MQKTTRDTKSNGVHSKVEDDTEAEAEADTETEIDRGLARLNA